MLSVLLDTLAVLSCLFLVHQVSLYAKNLKSLIEERLKKAKSDRAAFLLDKVLTSTLAIDRLNFAQKLPELRSEIEAAKAALDETRRGVDEDRSAAILASETEFNTRSEEYAAETERRAKQEREKIQESVDERKREREATSKRVFQKAKEIDHFFTTVSGNPEGPKIQLNLEILVKQALVDKLATDQKYKNFARHVFAVNPGEEAERLVTLATDGELAADELCRLLEGVEEGQGNLKKLLTELLLEAVKTESGILFEALRVTRGDERLLKYINELPLSEVIGNLKTSDDKEIVSLVLDRFKGAIADKEELTLLADFCERADLREGGLYVDWHGVDSGSLSVCRRLTTAEKYAEMVKAVIHRQAQLRSASGTGVGPSPVVEAVIPRQARKSIC